MTELWKNSAIIAKRNVDLNQTPISISVSELKQIIDVHSCIVLNQLPDEEYGISIGGFSEVDDINDLSSYTYKVDYANGVIYFKPTNIGKSLVVNYYGIGYTLLSASRIYTRYDKHGNVLETLEELLDNVKLQLKAIESLGGAVSIINKLDNDIATGVVLSENLSNDITIAIPLQKSLNTDIEKAKPLSDQLNKDIKVGSELDVELNKTIGSAKETDKTLNQSNVNADSTNARLRMTIDSAQDSIGTINATGNKSLIIEASQFVNNQYTWTHSMNNDNLIVNFMDSTTNEPLIPDYKIVNKNNILIRNSVEHPSVKVILSASYYQGNALFGTNIEEFASDSIGVNSKKVRLRNGDGIVENPITDTDAVFMGDGKTKLTKKIVDIDSQLEQNMNESGSLNGVLTKATKYRSEMEVIYYQAEIKNPIGVNYNNVPIALKVKFSKGECISLKNIAVKDSSLNVIPFQWEGEKHPNYVLVDNSNLETYSDGSLNSGTIWVIGNLLIGESSIYTVEIYNKEIQQSFADNIPLYINNSNPSSIKDELSAGICKFQFDSQTGNYQLRRYYQNNVEIGVSGACTVVPFIRNSEGLDIETQNSGATLWTSTKEIIGSGVIYKDYVIKNILTSKPSVIIKTIYRMFANGYLEIDCRLSINEAITDKSVTGFGLKFKPLVTGKDYSLITDGISQGNANNGILYKIVRGHMTKDLINYNTTYNDVIAISNIASTNNIFANYAVSIATNLNKNSMFYIKSILVPLNETINNIDNENELMNSLSVHVTKLNKPQLKRRYFNLLKEFSDHMHSYNFGNSFKGLVAYEKLAYDKFNYEHINKRITNIDNYVVAIKNTYQGASMEGFKMMWNANVGVQIIGRDTSPIEFVRKEALSLGYTKRYNDLTSIIHSLADFYVWLEDYSGGNGKIILYKPVGEDNMNSEATAMRALKNSLRIESNTTRQACYDRIKNRFEGSMKYKTYLPYIKDMSVLNRSQFHYACFSIFDYLDSVDFIPSFDIASYINQAITPSGKVQELGFNFAPERMGFSHTNLYASYALYHYGTISSLESACLIVENLLNQCYPSGYHVYPLDGWKKHIDSIDQPIETQCAYNPLMESLYNN